MKNKNQNKRISRRFWDLLIRGGTEEDEFRRVERSTGEFNRKAVLLFSVVGVIGMASMAVVSCFLESLEQNRPIYLGMTSAMVAALLLSTPVFRAKRVVQLICTYLFAGALLLFGVIIGVFSSPTELSATFIAFLLVVPQTFIDRPFRMCLLIVCSDVLYVVLAQRYKDPAVCSTDVVNCIVFGALSLVLCVFVIQSRLRRYCLEEHMRSLAETDQLTGVKNRNCFEERFRAASQAGGSAYCVYVDANDLHELNNTRGHEAGDNMLRFIATVLVSIFGADCTYRVGGDEFVAFCNDGYEAAAAAAKLERLKNVCESAGYNVAAGLGATALTGAQTGTVRAADLIAAAEAEMYRDKDEYYRVRNLPHVRNS